MIALDEQNDHFLRGFSAAMTEVFQGLVTRRTSTTISDKPEPERRAITDELETILDFVERRARDSFEVTADRLARQPTKPIIILEEPMFPAGVPLGEGDTEPTAGGIEPCSAPGLFFRIRRALGRIDQTAAGAATHGPDTGKARRRQRAQEHACANLALETLESLGPDQALAIVAMHLRARADLDGQRLHGFANAMSRHADKLEREKPCPATN